MSLGRKRKIDFSQSYKGRKCSLNHCELSLSEDVREVILVPHHWAHRSRDLLPVGRLDYHFLLREVQMLSMLDLLFRHVGVLNPRLRVLMIDQIVVLIIIRFDHIIVWYKCAGESNLISKLLSRLLFLIRIRFQWVMIWRERFHLRNSKLSYSRLEHLRKILNCHLCISLFIFLQILPQLILQFIFFDPYFIHVIVDQLINPFYNLQLLCVL
jgi:hypothetical protein